MSEKLRSLENYKEMHREMAKDKGFEKEFMAARTLTQAKKLAYGEKKKQYAANRTKGSNK